MNAKNPSEITQKRCFVFIVNKTSIYLKCNTLKNNVEYWACYTCTLKELPFSNERSIEIHNDTRIIKNENKDHINAHRENLQEYKTFLKVTHLNRQSTSLSFDEFQITLKNQPFEIITLSETYQNRDERRGRGVDPYIKYILVFKEREYFSELDTDKEHILVERQTCLNRDFLPIKFKKTR